MVPDSFFVPTLAPHLAVSVLVRGGGRVARLLWGGLERAVRFLANWVPPLKYFMTQTVVFNLCLMGLKSEGAVRLGSADWRDPPRVDPKYMTHPEDIEHASEILGLYRSIIDKAKDKAKAILGWEIVPGRLYKYAKAEKDVRKYVRDFGFSFFHPVGTCRMGTSSRDSVVDHELRVHGFWNIRVADASIAPTLPST
eukprot:CAMPEP_0206212486 /NCGR_PEP_ID=MMETSP0047_2-20121206/595_1 /ASSEMBLY_ACC=CAM_ASM_000192 /TAXON_ID=195065 /ORGANISM="Chroomonas mesostigmatica_cf, Strain CCMP1168" /LENGTH=195 /DNA_ID=CAMNT_0053634533 /DNA_START=232 /DNA_END=815 /DNA_ORIENTATION=+